MLFINVTNVVIRCNNNLTGERINYFELTLTKLAESEYKSELTNTGIILTFYYEKQQRPISYVISTSRLWGLAINHKVWRCFLKIS